MQLNADSLNGPLLKGRATGLPVLVQSGQQTRRRLDRLLRRGNLQRQQREKGIESSCKQIQSGCSRGVRFVNRMLNIELQKLPTLVWSSSVLSAQ